VAVYFPRSKHISRSNGSRVTWAAAYRPGERIRNEATSEVFDYSSRSDVIGDIHLYEEPDQVFFDIARAVEGAVTLVPLPRAIRLSGNEHFVID
jgi:hypothetical protein